MSSSIARSRWTLLARILVWVGIALTLALLFGWYPMRGHDMSYRSLLGQQILSNWASLKYDIFSYTAYGNYWVNNEWLSDIIIYLYKRCFGEIGFALFRATAVFIFSLALIFIIRLYTTRPCCILLGTLAVLLVSINRFDQNGPCLISYAFFGSYLFIWEYARLRRSSKALYVIVPMHILWFNLHGGAILGLGTLSVLYLGELASWLFKWEEHVEKSFLQHAAVMLGGCMAVSLINPYGTGIYIYTVEVVFGGMGRVLKNILLEWFPLTAESVRGYSMISFLPFVLIGLGVSFVFAGRKFRPAHLLALIPASFLGFRAIREIPEFATLSVLVAASNFAATSIPKRTAKLLDICCKMACFAAAAYIIFICRPHRSWNGNVVATDYEPVAAVEYLDSNNIHGRAFNTFMSGPYLIWKRWPQNKIFIDGRLHLYGLEFCKEYFDMLYDSAYEQGSGLRFEAIDKKWDFDYAILSKSDMDAFPSLFLYLSHSPRWKTVFYERGGAVFLKNIGEHY